jgi:hypothetical protein
MFVRLNCVLTPQQKSSSVTSIMSPGCVVLLVAPCMVRGDINHPPDSGYRSAVHTAVSGNQHAVNGVHNKCHGLHTGLRMTILALETRHFRYKTSGQVKFWILSVAWCRLFCVMYNTYPSKLPEWISIVPLCCIMNMCFVVNICV